MRPGPLLAASLGVAITLGVGGCRTHEPRPIDASALADAFLARTPELPVVGDPAGEEAGPGADFAGDDRLDVDRAVAIALVFNADLRVHRAESGVARAIAENAGLWPDPEIGLEFTRIIESVANPNELFGTIAFTIPISGRLEIEKERLGLAHAAELAEIAAAEWRVAHELRRRWTAWSALDAEIESASSFLEQAVALVEVVAAMESMGELPRIEARLFRLALLRGQEAILELEARRERARFELLDLMGLPPGIAPAPGPRSTRRSSSTSPTTLRPSGAIPPWPRHWCATTSPRRNSRRRFAVSGRISSSVRATANRTAFASSPSD